MVVRFDTQTTGLIQGNVDFRRPFADKINVRADTGVLLIGFSQELKCIYHSFFEMSIFYKYINKLYIFYEYIFNILINI